jgi:beta-galactosidase GanA
MSTSDDPGYDGPATLVCEGREVEVAVILRGLYQPIDGRYHWHGRVAADDSVTALARAGSSVVLRTPEGQAPARLADQDPWGRYRVTGTGRPPYRI